MSVVMSPQQAGAHIAEINSDIHASDQYRRAMIPVFAERALKIAMSRAG